MSKQAQHAPGPWRVAPDTISIHTGDAGDDALYVGAASSGMLGWPRAQANARLIAAAPCLLAACELAWDAFGGMDWASGSEADAALSALESAIAKARGAKGGAA